MGINIFRRVKRNELLGIIRGTQSELAQMNMTTREALLLVYVAYLADFGEGYDAESFIDFAAVALVDAGKLKVAAPHDALSLIRWFREHADRLEAAIPSSE